MSGIDTRIAKLFDGKQNVVISALDHVMEYGDQPGIEDSRRAIEACRTTDALLLSRFMLKRNADFFGSRNAPVPIVRLNWSSSYYYPLEYNGGFTSIATSVEDAVAAGGEMIICSLFLENENEEMETENVRIFSELVRQKERLGIPLMGECYVVEHAKITPEAIHKKVKRVTRVMAELGADLMKCFYAADYPKIVDNLPIPTFIIGAEKLDTDLEVLQKARDGVADGARGVVFGRNIFMAENPPGLVAALNRVLNDSVSPEEAVKEIE